MTQNIPGDVNIKTVSLYTDKMVINMTEHVQYISIYESIISPGFVVQLSVNDTLNLLTNLPILGGEKITIELSTPGRNLKKLDLQISSVKSPITADNSKQKSYIIESVSPEIFFDKTVQICKSYNTNISSIIQNIITQYLKSTKTLDIQSTKGTQKIILPSVRPLKAISMLRKRAVSVDDNSSLFVFFENDEGLHFKTLEKLLSEGSIDDRVFFMDQTIGTDLTKSPFRNILSITQPEQFDLIGRMNTGGLSHETNSFDIKTFSYSSTVSQFDPSKFKSADGEMKSPDTATTTKAYKTAGTQSRVFYDSSNPNTFIPDTMGTRRNIVDLLGRGMVHIHVFGDSSLTVGQKIQLKIAENTSSTGVPTEHRQLSGNYIIAFLHHIILPEGNMPRYTCSIEAIKGSYKESV